MINNKIINDQIVINNGINYIDLFSGIGGFVKGIEQAGIKLNNHYYSEIDKNCINIYEKHFPKAKGLGDIKTIKNFSEFRNIDLITFGFPCQDLSIAGKRTGFDGNRSGLFFEAIRLVKEIEPTCFIFENVKGLITNNRGKDFIRCLQEISNMRNYDCEWQLVNSSWFLPQNRERIYFIGHLRGKSRPKVFPIRESDFKTSILQRQQSSSITTNNTTANSTTTNSTTTNNTTTNTITTRVGAETTGSYVVKSELYKEDKITNLQENKIKTESHAELYVIGSNQKNAGLLKNKSTSLTSAMGMGGGHIPTIIPVLTPNRFHKRQNGRRFKTNGEPSFTLTAQDQHGIYDGVNIRRLTPLECERLQGFPDNWTNGISDTQRYKCLGNAVTVPVVEEIVRRLFSIE